MSIHSLFNVAPPGAAPSPTPAQLSLEAFVSSAFFGAWIQDDDEVFEIIFQTNYSPKVKERYVYHKESGLLNIVLTSKQ